MSKHYLPVVLRTRSVIKVKLQITMEIYVTDSKTFTVVTTRLVPFFRTLQNVEILIHVYKYLNTT